MRHRASTVALLCVVWVTPVAAQTLSPLIVETLTTQPTTVTSGMLFTQTYRVTFLDLSESGKEIVVLEDRLLPGVAPFAPYEAVRLDVWKMQDGKQHIWDMTYTLRVIQSEKGSRNIPALIIPWYIQEPGKRPDQLVVNDTIKTDEVPVNYVTTVTETPFLGPRDQVDMGRLPWHAQWWGRLLYVAWVPGALLVFLFVRALQTAPAISESETTSGRKIHWRFAYPALFARYRLLRCVTQLERSIAGSASREQKLHLAQEIKSFLTAHWPLFERGYTPMMMSEFFVKERIQGNDARLTNGHELADMLIGLYEAAEQNTPLDMKNVCFAVRHYARPFQALHTPWIRLQRLWRRIRQGWRR